MADSWVTATPELFGALWGCGMPCAGRLSITRYQLRGSSPATAHVFGLGEASLGESYKNRKKMQTLCTSRTEQVATVLLREPLHCPG